MPATILNDHFGTPLSLGQTVKLVGVITGLNATDGHYGEVVVTPTYPGTAPQSSFATLYQSEDGVAIAQVSPNPLSIAPSMLVVGS